MWNLYDLVYAGPWSLAENIECSSAEPHWSIEISFYTLYSEMKMGLSSIFSHTNAQFNALVLLDGGLASG